MKYGKSKISWEISNKHLESSLRIATTSTIPDQCISFTKNKVKYPTIFMLLLLFLCFNKKILKNKMLSLTYINYIYYMQPNIIHFSSFSAPQAIPKQAKRLNACKVYCWRVFLTFSSSTMKKKSSFAINYWQIWCCATTLHLKCLLHS